MNSPDAPDIPDHAMRAAVETFVIFGRLRRKLQALPGDSGLTPAQTSVLVRMGKVDATSVGELAAAEQVTHQAMVKTVAALEAAGLIARHPDPADRRRQTLTLTPAGRDRAQGERQARQQWLARALAEHGTPEEIEAVTIAMRLLGEVADA
ncbi:MarR family winged helix-turn-helix transcriptional regulator [Catenulispora yoronensis]|uniref:MarR family winged helix-turn-helix transcriptional regulator n=1 Tax=Catenulispora yoronensis TaxID=450799 RepID=UPI0031D3EED3